MRVLKVQELMLVAGGVIRESDRERARQCRDDMEKAGDSAERMVGHRFFGATRLLGHYWAAKHSKACTDQVRLAKQRENIEKHRHGYDMFDDDDD